MRQQDRAKPALVVVGNGMAGVRFCERAVHHGLHERFAISIFAEEPRPGYDRVRLTSYLEHRDARRLELRPDAWYTEHGLTLHLGDPVVSITRRRRQVASRSGLVTQYDALVFATGSAPFVPPVEGAGGSSVFVYRTIEDVAAIAAYAGGRRRAAVIGGGLLGLEAAQAAQRLGLEVHVIERAPWLMARQLNEPAARHLEAAVRAQGIELHLDTRLAGLEPCGRARRLLFRGRRDLVVDLVIVSAGIRPRTEVARDAGFPCDAAGGLIVDDGLLVEDGVFAIGECASHRGRTYGLAAPAYAMAEIAAARLAGAAAAFDGAQPSTRLKMLGVDVVTMGDCGPDLEPVVSRGAAHHRTLFVDGGRLVGAMGVGEWPESARLQDAVERREPLSRGQRRRFERSGRLWDGGASVAEWPDEALVCNCLRIPKRAVCDAVAAGACDVETLARCTGASTLCGSCRPLLAELAGVAIGRVAARAWRPLLAASLVALVFAAVAVAAPPVAMADSVDSLWRRVDVLWREPEAKQVSGFSLLGVSLLGLLLSARKRIKALAIGEYTGWRLFHAVLGASTLVVLFAHTGFRFGANLNLWLMALFLAMNVAGAATGVVAAIETRGSGSAAAMARRFRPRLSSLHLYLSWPLPVLLLFHILAVYLH